MDEILHTEEKEITRVRSLAWNRGEQGEAEE